MDGSDLFGRPLTKLEIEGLILATLLGIIWFLRFLDGLFLRGRLNQRFSIKPRHQFCPLCLLVAPFLHVNLRHLLANSLPLVALAWFAMLPALDDFWWATAVVILVGGSGIWLFGSSQSAHVGASGLILGYLGFILVRGVLSLDFIMIALAAVVALFYRGLFWQIIPRQEGISTTGHFFGFGGGVLAAWWLTQL